MGASSSSLARPSPTPVRQEKTSFSQRTMVSHVQTPSRVRFSSKSNNTTTKSKSILIPPSSTKHTGISSSPDEKLYAYAKDPRRPTPSSRVYPTVSTPPQPVPNGRKVLSTPEHKAPTQPKNVHGLGPIPVSARERSIKPSAVTNSRHSSTVKAPLSRVSVAPSNGTQSHPSATRIVTKSPSRSTIGSSKTSTSSSSGALSSRNSHHLQSHPSRPVPSSWRSHHDRGDPNRTVKRKRTGEDITRSDALKPIREVEGQPHQGSPSQLPSRPPGLGHSNRNSTASSVGANPPVPASQPSVPSPQQQVLDLLTKKLSEVLARTSDVVLSTAVDPLVVSDQSNTQGASAEVDAVAEVASEAVREEAEAEAEPTPADAAQVSESEREETETSPNVEELPEPAPTTQVNGSSPSDAPHTYLSLPLYLSDPDRLASLLEYLSFDDWCNLFNTSKEIRQMISHNELLREEVLERFLKSTGYTRWAWREPEPIMISLTDMLHYIKSTLVHPHEYTEVSERFLKSKPEDDDADIISDRVLSLANGTRAYNRLVLRLRVQSEMMDHEDTMSETGSTSGTPPPRRCSFYPSQTSKSSTSSFISSSPEVPVQRHQFSVSDAATFRSPLYQPNRAALLRVFIPSPHGEWLSNASVLECEAELERAGLTRFMRLGDVTVDLALENGKGNTGKLIWDGCYLLDLDYTYSSSGDIPRHIPSLALPPSYFHGIIRGGPLNVDPIVRMDVSPWGEQIARNLQLMQDRMMAETPQGLQNVVRWVHRSTFTIRPPSFRSSYASSGRHSQTGVPIHDSNGQMVHPSWYGSVVVETDGTSEGLDDLKERCGPGFFPPRAAVMGSKGNDMRRWFGGYCGRKVDLVKYGSKS